MQNSAGVPASSSAAPLSVVASNAVVLSASKGGPWEADPTLHNVLAYTDDDTLYVAHGKKSDHHVLSYQARLRQNNRRFQIVEVPYDQILQLNKQSRGQEGQFQDQSARQRQVTQYLRSAAAQGVNDIHIVTGRFPKEGLTSRSISGDLQDLAFIQFRVHGELETIHTLQRQEGESLIATIYQSMCDVAEKSYNPNRPQNARLRREFCKGADLHVARVATGPTNDGQHCVLRLHLNASGEYRTLDQLGYLPEQVKLIDHMARRTSGLNILTGAVNSGKTTTLANLLRKIYLDAGGRLCINTLEDPPELPIPGANQKIVFDGNWPEGIDHALRTDGDILLIGEVRSAKSILSCITAALTGKPVWTTAHTNSTDLLFERFRDAQVPPSQLYDPRLFSGIVNQSLVQELCPDCRTPFSRAAERLPRDLVQRVQTHCTPETVYVRSHTPDCPTCKGRGILGRRPAAEVLVPDSQYMGVLRAHGALAARRHWVKDMGGITKCSHLIRLINAGKVDPATGERSSVPIDEDKLVLGD
ncbi:ATPase, T2SS/T4P/T4SS family [Achromobacter insuavis]|uniref:ATPase, T2SS/T4P/T4SS family n=1 Tax=Achromobacter insuavis TaxID=1287735 RepID=UPI001F12BD6A|nr:ATPase, T2SS/T4P/T4SS family [Achromobacter insuavis]